MSHNIKTSNVTVHRFRKPNWNCWVINLLGSSVVKYSVNIADMGYIFIRLCSCLCLYLIGYVGARVCYSFILDTKPLLLGLNKTTEKERVFDLLNKPFVSQSSTKNEAMWHLFCNKWTSSPAASCRFCEEEQLTGASHSMGRAEGHPSHALCARLDEESNGRVWPHLAGICIDEWFVQPLTPQWIGLPLSTQRASSPCGALTSQSSIRQQPVPQRKPIITPE